jgi:hypothetical protein
MVSTCWHDFFENHTAGRINWRAHGEYVLVDRFVLMIVLFGNAMAINWYKHHAVVLNNTTKSRLHFRSRLLLP